MDWKTLIFGSVVLLIERYAEEYRRQDFNANFLENTNDYNLPRSDPYDFIIVGGGAAGCAIANRLSQNPNVKVLLLEAGGNPPPQTEVPAFAIDSRFAKSITYNYQSVPQTNAKNRVQRATVGKILGGSSSINYMGFNRGNPQDFNNWAFLTDDPSWNYENVLENFKNTENYQGEFFLSEQHGTRGEIVITKQNYAPGRSAWLSAGKERGYIITDPNGPQQVKSISPVEYNKVQGRRFSSYAAFLKPIESTRPNLKVERYSEVYRILIDVANRNRAYGVLYKKHGVDRVAFSAKEVIVSAGGYGSPMLLQKSGIGPLSLLKAGKTPAVVDLPVGGNLQDHAFVPLKILVQDKSIMFDSKTDLNEQTVNDFLLRGEGPLTSTASITGQAFVASSVAASEEGHPQWPDVQFTLSSENVWRLLPGSYENETAIYNFVFLQRPRSRGFVFINTTDLNAAPVLDFNLLNDQRDIRVLKEAIKLNLELFETSSVYKRAGASYSPIPISACKDLEFRSDAYWDCYIVNTMLVAGHISGTCRMGRGPSDPYAVVDSKLRVLGVEGLRVADASVMPAIVNSNPSPAVYMIADKVSMDIRKHWGL